MGTPKALLQYGEDTFLDTLTALFGQCCPTVIVVLGAHAAQIRAASTRPATFALNPDYALGMTTSLQCGLRLSLIHIFPRPEITGILHDALH